MLSSLEMVTEPSGKTKTLGDLIKEGGILTPETPVHTSDDSEELKDYIESLIPAPAPSYNVTQLYENTNIAAGNPTEITLTDDYDKYDALYFDFIRQADNITYDHPVIVITEVFGIDHYAYVYVMDKYVTYKLAEKNKLTRFNVSTSQNVVLRGVYGIKY